MESSKQFFCHTCKKDFTAVVFDNEDVTCPSCKEYFVELIEDTNQLSSLNTLYNQQQQTNPQPELNQEKHKRTGSQDSDEFYECNTHDNNGSQNNSQARRQEEEKRSQQNQGSNQNQQQEPQFQSQTFVSNDGSATIRTQVHNINLNGQNANWINNISDQINNIVRSQGQTTTINQNGQNINVSTIQGQDGDTQITIANIESDQLEGDEDEDWEDVDDDGNPLQAEVQQVDIDINLEQILNGNINSDQLNQPNGQNSQQPQINLQNLLGNIGNLFGGGQNAPGQQVFTQVFNIMGGPGGNNNVFNMFNGQQFGNIVDQIDQNLLNQVMEQSLQFAQNQNQGIPTSRAFIEKLQVIKGSDLMVKKDCQVCFEFFGDSDQMLKLPCKHLFHKDCIIPWLDKHNTCPSCRHQLPTDDVDYENRRTQGNVNDPISQFLNGQNPNNQNNGNNGSNGSGTSGTSQPFNSFYHS